MLMHVVGLFDNPSEAQAVVRALRDAGFSDDAIMTFVTSTAEKVLSTLISVNFPSTDARAYTEGVRSGGALVMVQAETGEETNRAIEIINRHNVVDIHRPSGWPHSEENAARRPVDQSASDVDTTAFQEGTFEVRERDEEVVVDKQAWVVEEVIINKDVNERSETVRDTVRRMDVDIEEISGSTRTTDHQEPDSTSTEEATDRGSRDLINRIKRAVGLDTDREDDIGQCDPNDKS